MALFNTLLCLLLSLGLMIPLCIAQATTPPAITAPEPTLGPIPSYNSPPPPTATSPIPSYTPPSVVTPPAAPSITLTPPTSLYSPPPPFGTSIPLAPGAATTLPNGAVTASLEKLSIFGIVLVGGAALFV